MMKLKLFLVAASFACAASSSSAFAAQLITNGGFENGTYTSTLDGNSNSGVPVGWTPNAAYDLSPNFNQIRTDPNTGSYNLSISNYDAQPIAALSQTFSDEAGASYSGSLYVFATNGGDPVANFTASIDGASVVSLGDTVNSYTKETFSFVGTGSDTLTLAANTNPGEWYVDDVSVTGAAAVVSAAPEPGTWALMFAGVAMIGGMLRLGRKRGVGSLSVA